MEVDHESNDFAMVCQNRTKVSLNLENNSFSNSAFPFMEFNSYDIPIEILKSPIDNLNSLQDVFLNCIKYLNLAGCCIVDWFHKSKEFIASDEFLKLKLTMLYSYNELQNLYVIKESNFINIREDTKSYLALGY